MKKKGKVNIHSIQLERRIEEFVRNKYRYESITESKILSTKVREELLQEFLTKWQEYRRKKLEMFEPDFTRSLKNVVNKLDLEDDEDLDEIDDSKAPIKLMEHKDHNLMNSHLYNTYKSTSAPNLDVSNEVINTNEVSNNSETENQTINNRKRALENSTTVRPTKIQKSKKTPLQKKSERKSILSSDSPQFIVPIERFSNLGGIEEKLADIRELIEWPLKHPELYEHLGVLPPSGILLHGPSGCGKTLLAHAIAGELEVPFYKVSGPEIVSGMSGESEAKIRALFAEAKSNAPSIIFIDEIDAIATKRESAQREMEKRIVAQLLTCMDEITAQSNGKVVMVIGATNRPQTIDTALRRAGRFDREIPLGVPDAKARERILKVLSEKLRLEGDFDFTLIAQQTPGFVGADLTALTKEAAVLAVNRIFRDLLANNNKNNDNNNGENNENNIKDSNGNISSNGKQMSADESLLKLRSDVSDHLRKEVNPLTEEQLECLSITMEDFLNAIKRVQPSAKREGFATVPNVTWKEVGALKDVRDELELSIVQPIKRSEIFIKLGLIQPSGVLLYGPPGCGKTLVAKAIANDANANFISVKGPELLNKYVGESERAVRNVFQRARSSSPCIVFFDELDALCPKRSTDSSSNASERVVNQLLTEMDGLEERRSVFVIAATNRPDIIDPAMLRPGRLDKLLYVPLPTAEEREDILITLSKKIPVETNIDFKKIATDPRCHRFSGADLSSLTREASVECLKEYLAKMNNDSPNDTEMENNYLYNTNNDKVNNNDEVVFICYSHFDKALNKIGPSVSKKDEQIYNRLKRQFTTTHLDRSLEIQD